MTEREWLASASPVAMLAHAGADGYERPALFYASALCRLHPELLSDTLRRWGDVVERVLRGELPAKILDDFQELTEGEAGHLSRQGPPAARAYYSVLEDAVFCTWTAAPAEYESDIPAEALGAMRWVAARFVRDIFGNPFRPVRFSPAWRTATAVALARGMYEAREFGAMPILADALQDAGCDNEDVLTHCRDAGGTHVRGCWVIDSVLARREGEER
jgi:hypothetical protein